MNIRRSAQWRQRPGVLLLALYALTGSVAFADTAPLHDQAVLVELSPNTETPAASASYVSSGGWAVSSGQFLDAATYVFDLGTTGSVSQATLRLPIDAVFPQNGAAPIRISFFADDGFIAASDYGIGFNVPIAELDVAGLSSIEVDVTGAVNAVIQSSRYVGFRVTSAVDPGSVDAEKTPNYTGARFGASVALDFTQGAAPTLGGDTTQFDGFTLQVPVIEVPLNGDVNAQFRLVDPNAGIFQLTHAVISGDSSGPPPLSGPQLLNCEAFSPPDNTEVVAGTATYSLNSEILDVPSVNFNNSQVSVRLEYIEGSDPLLFETLAVQPVQSGPSDSLLSALGGGLVVEPSQDFIPLCHGWVLMGDFLRNRVVERNLINGETGATYLFNTSPDQFTLDADNNLVYMTVHPESERLYRLDLETGKIDWNPVSQVISNADNTGSFEYTFGLRDLTLGENGNVFAIMYDGAQFDPGNGIPFASTGLWLGLLNSNANLLIPSIPLEQPIRIEYDPVLDHVFLATESNLATFNFNPGSNELGFVQGTDIAVGSGCTDFDISPDGTRLAYTCPQGNYGIEDDTSIADMDPESYFNNDGAWVFENTPISATFNADGTLLIGTDNERLYFYDVVRHLILEDFEMGLLEGETVRKIRLSRDGQLLYIFLDNSIRADNSKFYWMPMPAISGTPL